MNFQPLFTTSRVVTALYRTVSTTVLFYYLMKRLKQGNPPRVRGNHLDRS
mgnify:CR=1 FL=1